MISNSRPFGRSFGASQMFFFSGIESSAGFPNITPRTICTGNFIHDVGLRFHRRSKFRSWELLLKCGKWFVYNCDIVFFEDTCQRFSYSFDARERREAKDLRDSVGSTILKNIPTSSSGDTFVVEDRVFYPVCFG